MNREPYPHLSDAELDEVIADWSEGERPMRPETALAIIGAVVQKLAARMNLNKDAA